MTITSLDIEILESLDFDHQPPCDGRDCDRTPEWRFVTACCGATYLVCGPCKDEEFNYMSHYYLVECNTCHAERPSADFYAVVEPL